MDMEFEVQKALYSSMMANSTLTNLVNGRIYDEPPTNCIYPYIVMGGGGSAPFLKHNFDGANNLFLITIFTNPGSLGFYPALEIASSIRSSLHLKQLEYDDLDLKNVFCIEQSLDRERDGIFRNIDLRYRVISEKIISEDTVDIDFENLKNVIQGTATVGTASTLVLPSNANRTYCIFLNYNYVNISMGIEDDAVLNKGVIIQPEGHYEMSNAYGNNVRGTVTMIATEPTIINYMTGG